MHGRIVYTARIEYLLSIDDNPLTKETLMKVNLKNWEECEQWLMTNTKIFEMMNLRIVKKIARKATFAKNNSFKVIKKEYRYYD